LTETPVSVSGDRKTFVYSFDNNVVCRRAEDLAILWKRQTDPDLIVWRVGISKDGSVVAASFFSGASSDLLKRTHVAVYDGRDGTSIAQVPVNGTEGVAISPDNKLLAAGQRVPLQGKKAGTQPTVVISDIISGRELATLIQDQFWGGGGEFLYAGFAVHGIQFTSDGKYLITSGLNTKVWDIKKFTE
jgi:WD40 repeat protein